MGIFDAIILKTNEDAVEDDPYSQIYSSLVECVLNDQELSKRISESNVIRFDYLNAGSNPIKPDVAPADLPELIFEPTSSIPSILGSCLESENVTYTWYLNTGDWRACRFLLPILYRLVRVMRHSSEILSHLEYHGQKFFVKIDVGSWDVDKQPFVGADNIRSWSASLPVTVTTRHKRENDGNS